jgi:hypothetical protein
VQARYSRWDDTQDPFGPELSAGELLEELSDDALSGLGIEGALSRLLRRGMRGSFDGLNALRDRLRERRAREQANLDLAGPLEELRDRLDDIVDRERSTLSFRAEDDARMREGFLDALPPDVPGQIRELSDYRFVDPEAQEAFDELLEHIREQVMGAYFRSMAEGMRSMSPEDLARFRDMLAELNRMIEQRDRGEPYDFEGFMQRHGDFFPATRRRWTSCSSRWPPGWPRCPGCSRRCRRRNGPSSGRSPSRSCRTWISRSRSTGSARTWPRHFRTWGGESPRSPAATNRCRSRRRSTRWNGCTTSRSSTARSRATTRAPRSTTWTRRPCAMPSARTPSEISGG